MELLDKNIEPYHLIFIDDDNDFLRSMNMALPTAMLGWNNGFDLESHFLNNVDEGLAFIRELVESQEKVALIVSDQQMPGLSGIEFLEEASAIAPKATKILLTGYASLDSAKYAINHQILDQYIYKPIEDYNNFMAIINNAIKTFYFKEEKEKAEQQTSRYVQELELSNKKIKSMHKAAEEIACMTQSFRNLDLDDVLELIVTKLPIIFNARYSSLFLVNSDDNSLHMAKSNHIKEAYKKSLDTKDMTPMAVALREDRVLVVSEVKEAPYDFLCKEDLGNSCIIIPFSIGRKPTDKDILCNTEEIKGVLNMGYIMEMESEDIINYAASLIKSVMGINILNARLYQKAQNLALVDALTGLHNKYVFNEFFKKECELSKRRGTPFFLAILDIDDFKSVNDNYGHRIGDEVLKELGVLFRNFARKSDVIARFGGEEFSWIIQENDQDRAVSVLERIRCAVSNSNFSGSIKLSISLGMTQYRPEFNEPLEEVFERADTALYRAKANGKNRVEFF